MSQQIDPNAIWTPNGYIPPEIRQAQQAVEAYSPDLELGKDESRGTWVALWKNGPDGKPFPACGLTHSPDEPLPGYEAIQRILYNADVARNGKEFIENLKKKYEERKLSEDKAAHERNAEIAERLEHTFRRHGKTSYTKVYLPGKDF